MTLGLAVSDVVSVSVTLQPLAVAYRNFGQMMIVGSTEGVIDVSERIRQYSNISGVSADFANTSPEYKAAQLFFEQDPQPSTLMIARWAQSATKGVLHGGLLSASQQALANFTAVTAGSFHISIDGTAGDITGINLSGVLNLNGVASAVQTALDTTHPGATCVWNAAYQRFDIYSGTTGSTSSVSYASAAATGTDISTLLALTSTLALAPVAGIVAETIDSCISTLANISAQWYGVSIAAASMPATADYINVANVIQAQGFSRIFGITTQDSSVLSSASTSDIAAQLQALNLSRTLIQYSSSNPYAVVSILGRIATVNFDGSNTTLTVKFKLEPGVNYETLTESQAAAAKSKNCNIFVLYNDGSAIIQEGVMCNGWFIDERHGADWLQNRTQNDLWNVLRQSPTKIPQTDAGVNVLVNTVNKALEQAITNGFVAPGVWNAPGFGQLAQGDYLSKGYYTYAPPVATQSQADREARKAPLIQCAIKLAGAIHFAGVAVSVNR